MEDLNNNEANNINNNEIKNLSKEEDSLEVSAFNGPTKGIFHIFLSL